MENWDAFIYLKYKNERTQPAIDLVNRINSKKAEKIIDIGCGPGNSTQVLADFFPHAFVLGVDNSEDMIFTAQKEHPKLHFRKCDISCQMDQLDKDYDIVFSNACLQWVPNHFKVVGELLGLLKKDGILAIQIPFNFNEPIHQIIWALSTSVKWVSFFPEKRIFHTLNQSQYYDLLTDLCSSFSIWETTYYHIMKSHADVLEWYRGTGLRPYLGALPSEKQGDFEADVLRQIEAKYPKQKDGAILFKFPRLFFTACPK